MSDKVGDEVVATKWIKSMVLGQPLTWCRFAGFCSGQHTGHNLPVHIGQTKIAALKSERQFLVVQSQQMQNGRVDIVDVTAVFHGIEPEFVRLSDDCPRFCASNEQRQRLQAGRIPYVSRYSVAVVQHSVRHVSPI